jgi:hypothetical protein
VCCSDHHPRYLRGEFSQVLAYLVYQDEHGSTSAKKNIAALKWLFEGLGVNEREFRTAGLDIVEVALEGDSPEVFLYLIRELDVPASDIEALVRGGARIRNQVIRDWVCRALEEPQPVMVWGDAAHSGSS